MVDRTIDALPTPSLLLDLDVLEANLRRMQTLADRNRVRLRPHVKTHKCIEIARRQAALGARGLTVSTFHEAKAFLAAGFDDLTWALPNPLSRLDELLALPEQATLRVLVDDLEAAKMIEARAQKSGRRLHIFIKIDCGYHRAGIDPRSEDALRLAELLARSKTLAFDGILTHAGHSYHAKTQGEVRAIARQELEVMLEFKARAEQHGLPVQEISIGSTPTLANATELPGATELRPGNYVFFDYTQVALGSCTLADCALTVLASVISHQKNADWFVTDAGALSLSKDTGPDHLSGPNSMGLVFADYASRTLATDVGFEQLSQEHGLVRAGSPEALRGRYPVGARVRVLEMHSCLTAASFDAYQVVRGDRVLGVWPIARAH